MNNNSYIGKIDPQLGGQFGSSQLIIYHNMDPKYISDKNIYNVLTTKYVINYLMKLLDLCNILPETRALVEEHMLYSELPHEQLFDFEECRDMLKLKVREQKDDEEKYFCEDLVVKNFQIKQGWF